MLGVSRILRYRYLYTIALVIVTALITYVEDFRFQIGSLAIILLIGLALTRVEYQETRVQPATEQFRTLLDEHIFPRINSEYEAAVDDAPDIRINIMLKRRRHLFTLSKYLEYPPWRPTLKIEASDGYYSARGEDEVCWKLHQGVAGAAMNTKAQEAWSDLDEPTNVVQAEWQLTDEQMNRTQHLGSVLSAPIYLPSDTENPVGVINFDSRANLDESRFGSDSVRNIAIYWSNIIGAIVE